jgi:hypothetical protein
MPRGHKSQEHVIVGGFMRVVVASWRLAAFVVGGCELH